MDHINNSVWEMMRILVKKTVCWEEIMPIYQKVSGSVEDSILINISKKLDSYKFNR